MTLSEFSVSGEALRCSAKPSLEGRATVLRASRAAFGSHRSMGSVEKDVRAGL
jgi:hypothetical protein